ncbi:MAG: polysaccharide lyase 6 family protein [Pseudomonadota bacterium]|nr:polysaccharide lyase 6 family protein [Pseudomonadota bacterium]
MIGRLAALALLLWSGTAMAQTSTLVRTPAEYDRAVRAAGPGDSIVLADGVWRDFQVVFDAQGEPDKPVTLTAQTPGGVILSGQSNLRMAGEHLVVANLVFRDGWSPTGEVVSFRRSRDRRAGHSRVTGLVIDGFSKPDRTVSDHWVAMYGSHNRFDHSHLSGKTNAGTTMVVVRDAQQGLDNRHRIDHNYFGPRPNLGSNGGETLRVGTSADSLSASNTVVENNWFEGCDGEVEIVSNKSGGNTYRGNVFFHSRGALVLRHGDGNLVEDNVFIGGGKAHTGGVRVINRRQTVRNNYMEGLAGEGFASAITVMYGVPDSPINRYHPVVGAVIENNTIVGARSLFLGAGMDDERSAAPRDSRFANNLIVNAEGEPSPLRVLGDLSGIAFDGNVQSPAVSPGFPGGVAARPVELERGAGGLLVAQGLEGVGARRDLRPIARAAVGVDWYPKAGQAARLDSGATIMVAPGEDRLAAAAEAAGPGDILMLEPGRHSVDRTLALRSPLTVRGPASSEVEIAFSRPALFQLEPGGSLRLSGVTITGRDAPDVVGNAVIRIAPGSNAANYELILEDSRIADLTVNRGFDVISAGKGSMADVVVLRRLVVENITGAVLSAAAETDDRGTYNVEQVIIEDAVFRDIGGPVLDLYRGGTDESTFGPQLAVTGSVFERAGSDRTPAVLMRGVQSALLRGNRFTDSGAVRFTHRVGEPALIAGDNLFVRSPGLDSDTPVKDAR